VTALHGSPRENKERETGSGRWSWTKAIPEGYLELPSECKMLKDCSVRGKWDRGGK